MTAERTVLVINTRDVPEDGDVALLVRQAVDIALQTPYGLGLVLDKERVLTDLSTVLVRQRTAAGSCGDAAEDEREFERIIAGL